MATADPLRVGASSPEERVKHSEHRTEQLERRKELMRRSLWIVAFIVLMAAFTLSAAAMRETQDAADSAAESARSADAVADFVADCTTPKGQCYKEQQNAQREERAATNEIIYLANACSTLPEVLRADTILEKTQAIRDCVSGVLLQENPSGRD